MQLKQLFADEDAVSPVIGVILMVAITVILAAVIGTFVLGLGENVQDSAPQANFQFEYTDMDAASTAGSFDITHTGGEDVDADTLTVNIGGTDYDPTTSPAAGNPGFSTTWSGTVSTGDTATFSEAAAGDHSGGQSVRVIWTSPSGGTSNTIGQSTIPS